MPLGTFQLNDPEAYDIICRRRAPAGRNPRGDAPVKVISLMDWPFERDNEAGAQTAFEEWQWHVDAGGSADSKREAPGYLAPDNADRRLLFT